MSDLDKLIEAVGAGNIAPFYGEFRSALGETLRDDGVKAFDGSLDAAKRLHEALLPGWIVRLTAGTDQSSFPHVHVFKPRQTNDDEPMGANSSGYRGYDPARAWLLAVLRALRDKAAP